MKVLQLIDSLNIGGAERMSVNIANTLTENGIENYLVASREGGVLQQFLLPGVSYYCLHKKNGFDLAAFYRLVRLVTTLKPDIIHAHSTSLYWAVGLKLVTRKRKIIWHDHYGLSDQLQETGRPWLKKISRWIDGVIVVNTVLEKWNKAHLQVAADKIVYLKNFPYLAIQSKNLKKGRPVLLNLANFRPQKDQLNLLEAVSIVKQSGIDFKLWLAGEFVDKDWLLAIQNKIERLGLSNEVKITGPIENSADVLSKATIGILSSSSEGLPVTLLEYGLAGLPVICTDTGQCREVLGDGKYGLLVPPRDSAALAKAIIKMMTDPIAATQMAMAFTKQVAAEYGAGKFLQGYLLLIKNIIQ